MAEVGRWNGHLFTVSPDVVRGFTGLSIKGSSETEDKTKENQKYVTRKNSKPAEVKITVTLNQMVGCDVRGEAIAFVQEALSGASDYFYVGSKKLLDCKLMLTDAQVKETIIIAGDLWLKADVDLTMKQCDKYGSIASGGDGKKKKKKKSKKKGGLNGNSDSYTIPVGQSVVVHNPKDIQARDKDGNLIADKEGKAVLSAADAIASITKAANKSTEKIKENRRIEIVQNRARIQIVTNRRG